MVSYNGLVKRGQRVPETPSLWEAIMKKFDNGVTYDIDSTSCGIIEDAFRDAGTATIAEDYAKLTADAQFEFGENGRSELYKQMLRTKRELAAAIAKAEGLI